ncbi:MAG: flavodoxin [Acidaminococcus sp.]|nr:flavodoxin [Acidaminococcus sp.]MCI2115369.1 flavodoxin [Acidaminococcus sp.]MCI2117465.1 flavodoxin [Acidaminococcus sp.]
MKQVIKKMLSAVMMVTLILTVVGCGNSSAQKEAPKAQPAAQSTQNSDSKGGKTLVVYFSATGNTERVANIIAKATNADVFKIEPQQPYTKEDLNYNNKESRVVKEHANPKLRPAIKGDVKDWAKYDTVYVGFPHWWRQAPHVVYTFVENHDFSGKKVIPFCTSLQTPLGDSGKNLAKAAKTGNWLEGARFESGVLEQEVLNWVKNVK